jgi:hypothetical protein
MGGITLPYMERGKENLRPCPCSRELEGINRAGGPLEEDRRPLRDRWRGQVSKEAGGMGFPMRRCLIFDRSGFSNGRGRKA